MGNAITQKIIDHMMDLQASVTALQSDMKVLLEVVRVQSAALTGHMDREEALMAEQARTTADYLRLLTGPDVTDTAKALGNLSGRLDVLDIQIVRNSWRLRWMAWCFPLLLAANAVSYALSFTR